MRQRLVCLPGLTLNVSHIGRAWNFLQLETANKSGFSKLSALLFSSRHSSVGISSPSCFQTMRPLPTLSVRRSLFSSGCRYGVFAGHACDVWEFALDTDCIESDPDYQPSDEAFTMTTSHEGEPVEDVMFFGLMNTAFGSQEFDRILVLFVGSRAGLREDVHTAVQSVWQANNVG